jgi:hypothetical protein
MTAFEVTTWDEVLAFFLPDGELEGLWGWLEMLRRANDDDIAMYGAFQSVDGDGTSISGLPRNMGFFRRDDEGHIMVGGVAHSEFAACGRGLIYSLFKESDSVYTLSFSTKSTQIYAHPRIVQGTPDPVGARIDMAGITLDAIGMVAFVNVELGPVGWAIGTAAYGAGAALDLGGFLRGFLNVFVGYKSTGRYDSGEWLDMASIVPIGGAITDIASLKSNLSGWRVEWTP